jgi:hypothetical protein
VISLILCTTPGFEKRQPSRYDEGADSEDIQQAAIHLGQSTSRNGILSAEGTDLVFNARVFSFRVLSDDDRVYIVVRRLVAFDGATRPHIGEEREGSSEGKIEGDMTLSDCIPPVRNSVRSYVGK